ncbi:MAG: hypothetical protein IT317_17325 [Anaerolineales bacterium]|nr:hypothetical protein [Anaerolineales bacterium]
MPPLPSSTPSAATAFWSAAGLSFLVHWTLLVARLPDSGIGLAAWAVGDVAVLAFSLNDRRWAQSAGFLLGLAACGALWALWLAYAASRPGRP